ncbi:MAG: pyrroloquinoline quinone biosynthesis protein PqqB [Deltaproteobacteria bacterium]|nr:pyrroloquinoline quinone biosynthesis protein PqqB [Deltaproteobacteria bacterium]
MRLRVLGSAAGGGFPQWNCGCPNCQGVRSGSLRGVAQARRQESVALSADGRSWFLLNASPEIREQIESFPPLWPHERRHSPISGIVLTNGDLDHGLGLLSLRESYPITIYATEAVRRGFTDGNVLYRTLERFAGQTTWQTLALGIPRALGDVLSITPFAVPGKRPVHLEGRGPDTDEDNVGLLIRDAASQRSVAYVPAAARWTTTLDEMLVGVDAVFFDGTFWSSAELVTTGVGTKRAEDMAHLPVGGPGGGLTRLQALTAKRRILIHINNTNPLLRDDSPERAEVTAAGIEIAFDGMEIAL